MDFRYMQVLFLESDLKQAELVAELRKSLEGPFIVVKPELGIFPRFLKYCLFSTYKSFQEERAPAKDFALSWLCFVACTPKIDKALALTAPRKNVFAVVSESPAHVTARIGREIRFPSSARERAKAEEEVAREYDVSKAALENYCVEDLLIEKAAVSLL
ncbi:MAG: hypothetical protein ACP5IG_03080 [Candidatus Micrarchaeia archaeon]